MRNTIRFVHKGQIRELEAIDPTQTVLNFLRYEDALTGTKEGCAEGDCGACTVVLGDRMEDGTIRYQAVNACIQFLPMLDGRELITVEDLQSSDGTLHPVQQAMIGSNATQCGFCTPGFVMSLFAEKHGRNSANRQDINNVLAGNLCRCTGYGTIIDAAEKSAEDGLQDSFHKTEKARAALLETLGADPMLSLDCQDKQYYAPTTVEEFSHLLKDHPDAVILAGATDIGLWVTKQHRRLETIIYLGRIKSLKSLDVTNDKVTIGAGVTYSDAWQTLGGLYPDLGELIRRIASTQIRNSGTIGGNIANGSPIGDTPPALIALDATLTLTGAKGSRNIPLEDFFIDYGKQDLKPGEFVEKVSFPSPSQDRTFRTYKLSKRFDQDISAVCGAFNLTLDGNTVKDIRICYGGMAGTPLRAGKAETALTGKDWTLDTVQNAMQAMEEDYSPLTDMRASREYRLSAAQNLLLKFFIETTEPEAETRLVGDLPSGRETAHA